MQPAGEPGKTGGGFAIALLSLDAHRGDMGRGGWGGADGTGDSAKGTKDISYPKDAAPKDQT